MKAFSGKIDHDIDVTESCAISGQVNGNVIVHAGAQLRMSGQTNGDVVVLEGGLLFKSGQSNGKLFCRGGTVELTGRINGPIYVESGIVLIAEGVMRTVGGQPLILNSDGQWRRPISGISMVLPTAPRWRWHNDGSMTRYVEEAA
jgi:hypothetical protein